MTDSVRLYLFVHYPQLRDKLISYAQDLGYDVCDGYRYAVADLQEGVALVDAGTSPELVVRLAQKLPVIGFLDAPEALRWPLRNRLDPHADFECFKQYFLQAFPPHKRFQEGLDSALVGHNVLWEELAAKIHLAAERECFILVQGESGTGKELVARSIHRLSPRANQPFVAINCGAIPHDLIESELFGYEKGAFTGAAQSKEGKFEVASSGTLFLDEIGDMPPLMQVKLLRVLQEKEFERLGSNTMRPFKGRVICATHRSLKEMVDAGDFRQDLYYRLNVLPLYLPPLRERLDDLEELVERLLEKEGMNIGISTEALALMREYSWPGNVRELLNILCRADVFFPQEILTADQLKSLFDDHMRRA